MAAAGIFCREWMPEYIVPILVSVNIFCLAKRNSLKFTNFFGGAGGNEGLGVFGICFGSAVYWLQLSLHASLDPFNWFNRVLSLHHPLHGSLLH
jgi:hypothetical protein